MLGGCLAFLLGAIAAAAPSTLPMRLGDAVRPLSYRLDLRVDPSQPRHSGVVEIALELMRPSSELRLHAKDLRISSVEFQPERGSAQRGRVVRADEDSVYLRFGKPLPDGRGHLRLRFTGGISDKDVFGLFRQREGGDWYAVTQFEDVGARLAFPLFDEPGWKVPWTLSLTVPQRQQAFANMPPAREVAAGKGWKRIEFKTTPPMPSYLLAFAVGPFDVHAGGAVGGQPQRFITPRGRGAEATYAASVTPAIVEQAQTYFGMPHPFEKLDSLAIPLIDQFSAMENPGLITYASRLMLARPGQETRTLQRGYVSTAAHEIAHQWFGNYVTMDWWDDLWLNESFASWMGDKITAQVMPQWRWETSAQWARKAAMQGDRLPSARRVRQPVRTKEELGTAFDEITYSKGQSVLAMFESWLGPERMQAGVRHYMAQYAWGSATGDQFIAALANGEATLSAAFASFIDQPGTPQLRMTLQCDRAPRLTLSQSRYRPLGAAEAPPALWQIPVVLRTPAGTTRHLLKSASETIALPDRDCPAWLQPNVGGHGYYRAQVDVPLLVQLFRSGTSNVNELLALLDDQLALAQSGDLSLATVLPLVERMAADPRRELREAALDALEGLQRLVSPGQRAAYAQLLQRDFGPMARDLGWRVKAQDDEDRRLLRETAVPLMADLGQDLGLREQALQLGRAWLAVAAADGRAHPEVLDPGLRGAVLRSAAIDGNASLFDELLALARSTPERALREDLIGALAYFADPTLAARARDLILDRSLDIRETLPAVLSRQSRVPALAEAALAFVVRHDAALRLRMARQAPAYLPGQLGGGGCSLESARKLQQLFGPRAAEYDAGPSLLAKTIERLQLCAAYREAQGAALQQYLQRAP